MTRPRREAQFLIEKSCPDLGEMADPNFVAVLPICLWVFYPPEPNDTGECKSPMVFEVAPEGLSQLERLGFPVRSIKPWVVCEHMGRLIE